MNRQQGLPLLQVLALPIYWLIGRELLDLGLVAASVFMLAAPFAIHTMVVGIGFIVSYVNQHEQRGITHSRRRDWLIAYAREAAVSIRQFYWLMPFREGFAMPQPVAPVKGPPILLIHGYGCNRGLWLPAARWFSRRGYRVSAISLHPLHCPIERYAEAIAEEIARVRGESGAARVALICHSMGGLAARAYLQRCTERAQDPRLAVLITLGTPHRGTHIARVGVGENARQMRYGSSWLEQLASHEALEASATAMATYRARIIAVASLQDNIVSRPFEQRLPGRRAILVRRQGHMSLATSPRVFRVIERILRRPYAHGSEAGATGNPLP
ncbi:MAG TPA: alpha/beta fold hydrolase [Lautropia sp.]|nr:alpha/beta fold hydrolase [Lautropia sp.]